MLVTYFLQASEVSKILSNVEEDIPGAMQFSSFHSERTCLALVHEDALGIVVLLQLLHGGVSKE